MTDSFQQSLEDWVADLLGDYVENLSEAPKAPKEFNDPVWGTILMRPAELPILDSPLHQRLRSVAQLGVVHLLYPAAGHTRLEHTLGVVHQVTRLVSSLNEHYTGRGEPVSAQERNLLRLTALCHDVGHGALSHVSENALQTFDSIQDAVLEFADAAEIEKAPLAEIASFHIVGSQAFRDLLTKVQALVPNHGLPEVGKTVDLMQKAIIGQPISDKVPLLHELISGPFDADKLDYMTRDAQMAGVPVVTDISRLVQKVRAVEISREDLRPEIAATVSGDEASYIVTGVALSGGRTIDELILGRTLQDDKLYRHHKVRAIEAMVVSLYRQLAEIEPDSTALLPYRLTDNDFASLTESRIEEVLGRSLGDDDGQPAAVALDLADRLRRRDLFVRAYAFSLGMPLDPYRADPDHYAGLERLARESYGDFDRRGQLVDEIVRELRAALEISDPGLLERYPDLKPYVWIDPLNVTPEPNDSARAYLVADQPGADRVIRFQDDYAETIRWASAYIQTREVGYVFAPDDLAQHAHVAVEKVLRREYEIRTPRTMQLYAKRPDGPLSDLKHELERAGYYDKVAYDIRPAPTRLRNADVKRRIEEVCRQLAGYEGPVRGGAVDKKHTLLKPERIQAWLRQFPAGLEDEPLRLLEEMRLVARHEVVGALTRFLAGEPGQAFAAGTLCPFGAPKDSSAVTTYWAGDEAPDGMTVQPLAETLVRRDGPIVFVEDFIGSGQQSVSILEAWLGEEQTTDLGEQREPLTPEAAAQLRRRKLGFVFAAGQTEGVSTLKARAEALELDIEVFLGIEAAPRAFGGGSDSRHRLEKFCREVGHELLLDPVRGHDEEWAAKRALGYGNNSFLVLFGYNTPSQTLTCIWKEGRYAGLPWMPLFPRRKKQ